MSQKSNENNDQTSSDNSVVLLDDEDNFQEVNYEDSSQKLVANNEDISVIDNVKLDKTDDNNMVIISENKEILNETKNDDITNNEDIYDVIIIGAGISGLSAAYCLKKSLKDIKILIIEAKDRVGGRTQTVELKSSEDGKKAKWDVGGQWVTDKQKNITRILNELKLETYKQFDSGKKILESKGKITTYNSSIPNISVLGLLDLQMIINKVNSGAKKIGTLNPFENLEFARRLDKFNFDNYLYSKSFTSSAKSVIDAAVKVIYGLELGQINTLFGFMYISSGGGTIESLALSDPGCAQEKKVKNGTQQISERLLENVLSHSKNDKFLLNTILLEVKQNINDNLVEIKTQNSQTKEIKDYKARKIISSIPLNQYIHIKFEPELPSYKRNVYKFSQMGNLVKFIVTYKEAFWRNNGYSGEVISDGFRREYLNLKEEEYFDSQILGPITCLFDGTSYENEPALIGFRAAKASIDWQDQEPEIRKKAVIDSLCQYFGEEARNYLDYYEKNWNIEKYIEGAPTCCVSSSDIMRDYVRAVREPFFNVHFCGTESATEYQGYMDGAVESGERAANEILYLLFKQDNTIKCDYEKTYYYHREKSKFNSIISS